ncbi:MAG TPA: ABC transporter permease [Vicinamibacterales bacterium]|nr:ABC transporter permease [Vicinamibacterales bacterium]
MGWIAQLVAVCALNIRTLWQRAASSAVAVVGIAGVVVVFVAVLSIGEGFTAALRDAGAPDRAIVLRAGSDTEMTSGLSGEHANIIAEAPGVLRTQSGPQGSPELFVIVDVPKRSTMTDANVPLRGVTPAAFQVKDEVRIVEGRRFTPGSNEIIVGRAANGQFAGLDIGSEVRGGQSRWTVVGIFEANGTVAESEIWCDARVLQPAYRRGNSFQSVCVRLESPEAFDRFKDALTTDPRLNVSVRREIDYYSEQSTVIRNLITSVGFIIAALMGIGAVFGAINTMYSAVANRTREIATLRALGFGRIAVMISVLAEALLLAITGGVLGGLVAWVGFDGYQTATMNWQSFSQVAFAFKVTPTLLLQGIVYAAVMGMLGGFFPAVRAARLPIVTALREL